MKCGKSSFTAEEDAFILAHVNVDMSLSQVANALGYGSRRSRIWGRYKRLTGGNGPTAARTRAKAATGSATVAKEQVEAVKRLFNGGWDVQRIADHTGLSKNTVHALAESLDPGARVETLQDENYVRHLEAKVKSLTKDIKTVSDDRDRFMNFVEEVKGEIRALPLPKRIALPAVSWKPGTQPLLPVAQASDWHGEETIDREAMEGLNEFNFQIFQERVWYWTDRVIRLCMLRRQEAPVDELCVDMLGDMMTGEIHDELVWTNQMRTPKAIVRIGMVMGQSLMQFLAAFPKVTVNAVAGNHGRNAEKYHFKQFAENNFDVAIYEIAKLYCREAVDAGRLAFNIAKSPKMTTDRFGWTFLLAHGGDIKCYNGISFYGVEKHNAREHAMRQVQPGHTVDSRDFHFVEMGHWHATNKVGNTYMNGSLSGPTEMTMNRFSDSRPPEQTLLFVQERIGIRAMETIPLWFADGKGHGFTLSPLADE